MKSYLLKIYYMNYKIDKYEYQTHEFLLNATPKTIDKVVKNEVEQFNKLNKNKVEQVSIFEHKKSYSMKGIGKIIAFN